MKNFLIVGKAGSGKDAIGDYLIKNYGYSRVAFADPMKKIAPMLWPELDWTQKQRVRLQQFGSKIRDIDIDSWVRLGWLEVERLNNEGIPAVVTDCRYPNELDFFYSRGNRAVRVEAAYTLRVQRLIERDGSCDESALKHISETALDGIKLPTLDNSDSFEYLYEQVDRLLVI